MDRGQNYVNRVVDPMDGSESSQVASFRSSVKKPVWPDPLPGHFGHLGEGCGQQERCAVRLLLWLTVLFACGFQTGALDKVLGDAV